MTVRVIANPASGRGRGARAIGAVRAAFAAVGVQDVRVTERAGDERRLALEALDAGCTTIAALGGDGTWSKVAAALVAAGADCRLALLAAGQGNDFAKSVGVPAHDYIAMARLAVDGPDRRIDVGRVDGAHFVNAAGFGFDAAVIAASEGVRWLSGDALYLYAALRELFAYGGFEARVGAGATSAEQHLLMLVVANGRRFGGSFIIAPRAELDDGALDIVSIGDASPVRRLRLFAAAMRGAHPAEPEVGERQLGAARLAFREPPLYEADGELLRAAACEVEVACVPAALRVVTDRLA